MNSLISLPVVNISLVQSGLFLLSYFQFVVLTILSFSSSNRTLL